LFGYKGYLNLYPTPFFGSLAFADLGGSTFDRFCSWARLQCYRGKPIENKTINKCFTVLKMICKSAAIEYGWGTSYSPFFGYKKLPEIDSYEKVFPFSIDEQKGVLDQLPEHWKPYFRFAFCCGLRPGEQIALKPDDIDWEKGILNVRRAITLDENGKKTEGNTKNRYSRRSIRLIPMMLEALQDQKVIHGLHGGKYFFCTKTGMPVNLSNLRQRVWTPAITKAGVPYREMKQTRHTFATIALSAGENPLWIAKVMGHRNTEMIIKVYSRYIENAGGSKDGGLMNSVLQGIKGNEE
jgi:integrase